MITKEVYKRHLIERHGEQVQAKLENASVGIAGLGGLGSNIALALARLGIRRLILVDFDCVELSNVNRQAYFLKHIGMPKTIALNTLIKEVNPFVEVVLHHKRVTRENALSLFEDLDVLVEAFDEPASKAALIETMLIRSKIPLVAASGMAGSLSSNTIVTTKMRERFYLCGDKRTDSQDVNGLMVPRVLVAASHQANMVLRLLLGEKTV